MRIHISPKVAGLLISTFFIICQGCAQPTTTNAEPTMEVLPGACQMDVYLPLVTGQSVGLVVNHTSRIGPTHLVDTLLSRGVNVTKLFAPEHGLRGEADAGAHVRDGLDVRTGIPVLSLYGDKKKPAAADLEGIEVLIFDIQDVGVRFYTYISTLHYILEAAAEHDIPVIVLDRPNPNGHYIDGPVLDPAFRSFVGMHPIPVVYGLTIGELARMILGEAWIAGTCELTVVPCLGYDHQTFYDLPVKPSPNLPNSRSVLLYPGLCFFEGTVYSVGRGTDKQFQVVGHPDFPDKSFSFVPEPRPGAMQPPLRGEVCYGLDLSSAPVDSLFANRRMDLTAMLTVFREHGSGPLFQPGFFDKLAGGSTFRNSIEQGWTEARIRSSWRADLIAFNRLRQRYLLYPDFPEIPD